MVLALLPACASHAENHDASSTTLTTKVATPAVTAPPTPARRTVNWVDLDVGQCVVALPHVELGEVSVTVVDCATPHQAEVFLRAGLEVNTAVPDIADRQCAAAFPDYTGQRVAGSPYTVTYLVDSQQDRTERTNPAPSTVICLLQDAHEGPLTGSARH